MSHRLIPDFIIENYAQGNMSGEFSAVSLFMDISGFTAATEALMAFGQHGAEVMAEIMGAIFEPLVYNVYAQGGFVTNFAGDAFTAVFPITNEAAAQETAGRALAAAWDSQETLRTICDQETSYGEFQFTAKAGLAVGLASWGILESADQQRAAYYFKGTAVTDCTNAEHLAQADEIVASPAILELLKNSISFAEVADHGRITAVHINLPAAQPVNLPPINVSLTTRFFPKVIVEQPVSGEFRLVFNVFINLKGVPTLAEISAFMAIFFTLQDQYGGVTNRIDYGDKGCHILAFWGVPRSYENDINRIGNFILNLKEKSNIPLRAGITYHIAHAGYNGSSLQQEYTCYGRGVNLAARFMVAAGWDDIWIDDETETRLTSKFQTKFLDFMMFKGFSEPQPVFALMGSRRNLLQNRHRIPLTGRDEELQQLEEAIAPLENGRFAGIVTILGEAGMGKSRLVYEFLERSDVLDYAIVFTCQTDEILRQSLNPFRYFLHEYFEQSNRQTEAANKKKFDKILDFLIDDIEEPKLQAELQQSRSFLGAIIDLYWPHSLYAQREPQLRFENTLAALKTLFKAESLRQPLIILLEDAQWLDEDSKLFLTRFTRNIDLFPITLIITSRHPLALDLFDESIPQTKVELRYFDAAETAVFIQSILHRQPPKQLVNLLLERSEGNPFFTEQYFLYLQENDLLERVLEIKTGRLNNNFGLPKDVRSLLVGRIDRLEFPVKDVVQRAAVLGREFETDILAAIVEPQTNLATTLETGIHNSIWFILSENRYLFKHHLLCDAAYDMQLRRRLKQLHQQAALAYETTRQTDLAPHYGQIAYHFDQAKVVVKALDYYQRAADHARDNYRNTEALAHYSRALALTTDTEGQYALLLEREAIYNWLGQRQWQKADLDQLTQLAANHLKKQTEISLRLSAYELVMGNYEPALAHAQQALDFAQQTSNALAQAHAYHRIGRVHWQQGHSKTAVPYLEQALSHIPPNEEPQTRAKCLYDLSVSHFYQSNYERAENFVQQAQTAYQQTNDKRGEMNCLNVMGIIQHRLGNYSEAASHYQRSLALCREVGWPYAETQYLLNLGSIQFELGDYESARVYLEQSLAVCQEIGDKEIESTSLDTLGMIFHYLGNPKQAIVYYEQALAIGEAIKNQRSLGFILTHLGYSWAEMGEYETAVSTLKQAVQIRETLGDDGGLIDTKTGLVYAAYLAGNTAQAQALATEISTWLETHGTASLELPIQVYLICCQALNTSPELQAALLQSGYTLLQKHAEPIRVTKLRKQFLEQVPFNKDLQRLWLNANA